VGVGVETGFDARIIICGCSSPYTVSGKLYSMLGAVRSGLKTMAFSRGVKPSSLFRQCHWIAQRAERKYKKGMELI